MKQLYLSLIAGVLLLSSGCATDYTVQAVKKAREYALEKYPDLSEEAVHWVRFTPPQVRQDVILEKHNKYSHNNFAQTCMIWDIPEYKGKSLVVVGFGEDRLKDWYPIRAMFKRYRYLDSDAVETDDNSSKSEKKKKTKRDMTLNLGGSSDNK